MFLVRLSNLVMNILTRVNLKLVCRSRFLFGYIVELNADKKYLKIDFLLMLFIFFVVESTFRDKFPTAIKSNMEWKEDIKNDE